MQREHFDSLRVGVANFSGGDGGKWVNPRLVGFSPLNKDVPMNTKVTIEVDTKHEGIVRRAHPKAIAHPGVVHEALRSAVPRRITLDRDHVAAVIWLVVTVPMVVVNVRN